MTPTVGEWAGRVARPSNTFQPVCWGLGFTVGDRPPEGLGVVVVTPEFEAIARIRVWRQTASEFSEPSDFVSENLQPLNLANRPPRFATMAWFRLPCLRAGAYTADIALLVGGEPQPFGIGVYEAPIWSWRAGYFCLADGEVRPTKARLGVVWNIGDIPREPERVYEVEGITIPPPTYARYDLISADSAGHPCLSLGLDRKLDPEEFAPMIPPGHAARNALYTTPNGSEVIAIDRWRDGVRIGEEAEHSAWLQRCRERLTNTMSKLRRGEDLVLAGYGDSITAMGARSPDQVYVPNGKLRDVMGYFVEYGNDWKASVPLFDGHQRLGWNWILASIIEDRWGVSVHYDNWGIAGNTSGSDTSEIDGFAYPNASNPERLKWLLESKPDLVTVALGTNDIGGRLDTKRNVVEIGRAIQEVGSEVIIITPPRPNWSFYLRDDLLWRFTHDRVVEAAEELEAACFACAELYEDTGALGLSHHSFGSAQSPWHPGARELAAIGRQLGKIFA